VSTSKYEAPRNDVMSATVLSTVCHDLRQPVAAIMMLAAAAASEDIPVATRARLDQIVAEASWISSIIRDGLAGQLEEEDLDLREIVRAMATRLRSGRVTYQLDVREHPVCLRGNGVQMRRALENLVDNAHRAAGYDGTVRLAVRETGSWAVIEVEDSGPGYGGIDSGSGLGLAQVADMASRHGGTLVIGRSRLGGARIRLRLRTNGQGGDTCVSSSAMTTAC
jgi:signal transduction histidine kinase